MRALHQLPLVLGTSILLASCATTTQVIDVPVYIQSGTLRVVLDGFHQRETLAALSDVHHVRFDLEMPQSVARSLTLIASQLGYGGASASVMFDDLNPGAATLSVTAFDNANISLATTSATTSIVSGVVTTVPITLQL